MNTIKFNLSQDNRPLKEDICLSTWLTSPFAQQYQKALSEIDQYLFSLDAAMVERELDYANNIFAFIGDRGSGKTSCMVSIGALLSKNKELRAEYKKKFPTLSDTDFIALDLIDPTYFDSKHNILTLFLSKLFSAFKKFSIHNEDMRENKKIEFLKSLALAQRHTQLIIGSDSDWFATNKVEEIESLSAAADLKKDLKTLVDSFMDCIDAPNCILLLKIDDIDLNAKEAGVMAEYIRKYFILPNVLVLMALKMDQLEMIKQNEYGDSFKKDSSDVQVIEMSERYLTKLFPHSQRIYMPNINDILDRKLELVSQSATITFPSVRQCVPELIFKKTRYLFYNSPVHASYIVPRNLRDLRQLIKLLWNMDDYSEVLDINYKIQRKGKYNQEIFKKYLLDVWVNNNLDIKHQEFARQIMLMDEVVRLNFFVVRSLYAIFEDFYNDNRVSNCADSENTIYNISLGDVLGIIEYEYRKTNNEEERRLLFFIKTVYSIRLYESYNALTDKIKTPPFADVENNSNGKTLTTEIFRNNQYLLINEYEKLVAGYVANVQLQPFLPTDRAIDLRPINQKNLFSLMHVCSTEFESAAKRNYIKLLEVFMLCVSHSKLLDTDYRKSEIVAYDAPVTFSDSLMFDLGAFFFNVTRIKHCYNRFRGWVTTEEGGDLIDAILRDERSLYADFMRLTRNNYKCEQKCPCHNDECASDCRYYESRWLSFSCFRNIEVLQDFIKYVHCMEIRPGKSDIVVLTDFFKRCAKYKIETYDFDNNSKGKMRHTIQFGFIDLIVNVLEDKENEPYLSQIYGEQSDIRGKNALQVT